MSVAFYLLSCVVLPLSTSAQGNYEIQVYPYETVEPRHTMVELHSNFTFQGSKSTDDGTFPTNHQLHETIEITHGFNEWFETGFYIFTSAKSGQGWDYVGSHIRPRVRVPPKWHWPVGVSLSNEIGWQSRRYSADTWTWEIRPIVDKKIGKLYMSFNPTIEKSFHGPGKDISNFSPNVKFSYDVQKKVAVGLEYYGAYGPLTSFDAARETQQMFLPAVDLDFGKNWEFNFGVGIGVTQATDHLIVKAILGYRFNYSKDN
jgi:hypothetical protein